MLKYLDEKGRGVPTNGLQTLWRIEPQLHSATHIHDVENTKLPILVENPFSVYECYRRDLGALYRPVDNFRDPAFSTLVLSAPTSAREL